MKLLQSIRDRISKIIKNMQEVERLRQSNALLEAYVDWYTHLDWKSLPPLEYVELSVERLTIFHRIEQGQDFDDIIRRRLEREARI